MGVILDWVGRPARASELGRKQTEEVHSVSTADMRRTVPAGPNEASRVPPENWSSSSRPVAPVGSNLTCGVSFESIVMRFTLLSDGTEVPCAGVSQIGP